MSDSMPWQNVDAPIEEINPVSSMMSEGESRFLHWAAAEYYRGEGEIIDGGCLLGGSTCALGSGLAKNRHVANKHKRIHSYDIFTYMPDYKNSILRDVQREFEPGDSLLPLWEENTVAYSDYVEVHAGDFCAMRWNGKPVEICFIDLAKTWDLGNHAIQEFFGCLIPGRSLVLHQDYLHHFCYWIHLTMEFFADYFERVFEPVGGTVAFRLTKNIPAELLTIDFERHFDTDEARGLMDNAIAGIEGSRRHQVATAKMKLLADRGQYEEAARIGQTIRDAPDFQDFLLFDLFQAEKFLPPELVLGNQSLSGILAAGSRNYNVFEEDGHFVAIHRNQPPPSRAELSQNTNTAAKGSTLAKVAEEIGERVFPRPEFFPILLDVRDEYQIVWFRNRYYRVPHEVKPVELTLTRVREACPAADRIEDLSA